MHAVYKEKMQHLFHMRAKLRGTQHGVSMPNFSFEDFWEDPGVLDCYLKIEDFKLRKAAREKRKKREKEKRELPYFARDLY